MDITQTKVLEIQHYARQPLSLDQTIGEESDTRLRDFIQDSEAVLAIDTVSSPCSKTTCTPYWPTYPSARPALSDCDSGSSTANHARSRKSATSTSHPRAHPTIEYKTIAELRRPSRSHALRDYLH